MTRLLILVEGQSEEVFVKRTLTPWLADYGVFVQPPIILWTKRYPAGGGYRGGASSWLQIQKNLRPLTQDSDAWLTTLIDFYGLPDDVPGYAHALGPGNPHDKVVALQEQVQAAVNHPRFIPFFALHEFEAWAFCAPDVVAEHFAMPELVSQVELAARSAGGAELINHGVATHPKARLKQMAMQYKETSDGPTLLAKIGLPAIRAACPHFASWLNRLEALALRSDLPIARSYLIMSNQPSSSANHP